MLTKNGYPLWGLAKSGWPPKTPPPPLLSTGEISEQSLIIYETGARCA